MDAVAQQDTALGLARRGLAYVYVVVTVERVDYYMHPLLPLCALVIGGAAARFVTYVRTADIAPSARYALLAIVPIVAVAALLGSRAPIAPYYDYNKEVYRNAVDLDRTLPKNALVVIGHYGPDVQYYIDRFGWEEDPALWTPLDEESAIRKGARYFISIEDGRLRHNLELCAWLQRFPLRAAPRRGRYMKRIPPRFPRKQSDSGADFATRNVPERGEPSSMRRGFAARRMPRSVATRRSR